MQRDGSPPGLERTGPPRAGEFEPVRRLEKDDLGSEGVLIGPTAADGQRRATPAVVGLGQGGLPASGADRCAECDMALRAGGPPVLTVLVELDARESWLSLAPSTRRQVRGLGPRGRRRVRGRLGLEGRQLEPGESGNQLLSDRRRFYRCGHHGGHQMGPYRVEDVLHVLGRGGGGDHRVLFGKHHAEPPVCAVAAVPVSGHPELEPVSLSPVRIWLVRSFRFQLHPGGLGDPLLRQQPLTVPDSTLQVQHPSRAIASVVAWSPEYPISRPFGYCCQPTSPMPSGSSNRGRSMRSGSGRSAAG